MTEQETFFETEDRLQKNRDDSNLISHIESLITLFENDSEMRGTPWFGYGGKHYAPDRSFKEMLARFKKNAGNEQDAKRLQSENEDLKTALQKALDAARFKPHIKEILAFHRQEFPFEPGEVSSEHRERYYWLSGFLHAYAEKWADIDDFGAPPEVPKDLDSRLKEAEERLSRVPYSK